MMVFLSILSILIILLIGFVAVKNSFKSKNGVVHLSALTLKIGAGICLGLVYTYYYNGGDTFLYWHEGQTLANFIMKNPSNLLNILMNSADIPSLADQLIFVDQPRALFFSKIVSVFYLLTGGNYWITGAFFSLINFLGVKFFVEELTKKFHAINKPAIIAFYFLPTFVFWTSGLLKESLAIAALTIAVGAVLKITRTEKYFQLMNWGLVLLSILLLWKLKYFYAALAIPSLIIIILFETIGKKRAKNPGFVLAIFISMILIVSTFHYNFKISRVLGIVYENYVIGIKGSQNGIEYYQFDGSIFSFLINTPSALMTGLFRPAIFEFSSLLQFLVAFENLIIFIGFILLLRKAKLKTLFHNPYVLISMIYIFTLSILLAFSTPNFGTLSRYKVGYWPFFVLLLLIGLLDKKAEAK